MSYASSDYAAAIPVDQLDVDRRAAFISNTYIHLFGAIAAFTAFEIAMFKSGWAYSLAQTMMSGSWLLVLGAFVLVNWFASRVAFTAESKVAQYAALAAFIVAQGLVFCPLLVMANLYAPGVIQSAAVLSLGGFAALTAIAFITRKDFSFLRPLLMWIGIGSLITIVAAVIFGFPLGVWFSGLMVLFAGGSILYDTSEVLHRYPEDKYVGASLQLFASVAMMFFYLVRLLMQLQSSD